MLRWVWIYELCSRDTKIKEEYTRLIIENSELKKKICKMHELFKIVDEYNNELF